MRKELTIYIPMTEQGEEVILQRTRKLSGFVTIKPSSGVAFIVKKSDLIEALTELTEFDKTHPETSTVETQMVSEFEVTIE